jgi:hypothetical protein
MQRRVSLWLLAWALLAAQTLGLLHRAVHVPAGAPLAAQAKAAQPGWAQDLFASHEGDSGCRLYDQLGASGFTPEPPRLPAMALPVFVAAAVVQAALPARTCTFDARGPPALH